MKIICFLSKISRKVKLVVGYFAFRVKHIDVRWIRSGDSITFYSQDGQDAFLASLLFSYISATERQLVFLDIGCNHPVKFSNSLYFEKFFGMRVVAVDPLEEYRDLWRSMRPSSMFEACALASQEGQMDLHTFDSQSAVNDMFSYVGSGSRKTSGLQYRTRQVPVTTVAKLLEKYQIEEVALCSIDVEGFELEVLKGIDYDINKILCFCIENNSESDWGAEEIREYLADREYKLVARIGYLDDVYVHKSLLGKILVE